MSTRWPPRIATSNAGGGGPPPSVSDHFAPRIIVGNELSGDPAVGQGPPFEYFPDPGDGSGITAALAVAISGYDVYVRPGTYTLPVGTHFSIPTGVRVVGAPSGSNGLSGTIIVASAGDGANTQDVFTLGTGAALIDIQIRVPEGANGGLMGSAIVTIPSILVKLRNVLIDMTTGGSGQRNTTIAVGTGAATAPCTGDVIEDVEVVLPAVASTNGVPYAGFFFGVPGTSSIIANSRGPVLRGCLVRGGQYGFAFLNIQEPSVVDCVVDGMILSQAGSNAFFWQVDTSAVTSVVGPKIIGPRVFVSTTGDAANSSAAGIAIENAVVGAVEVLGHVISGGQIVFQTAGGLLGARQGIKIRIEEGGTGQNTKGTISGVVIVNAQIDILIQSRTNDNTNSTTVGAINDWTITGVEGRGFATIGANTGSGVLLETVHVVQPKVNRISIVGSNFSGAPAGTNGVIIQAQVTNTILSSNQLTPGAGTAYTDNGIGSQIIGNIT